MHVDDLLRPWFDAALAEVPELEILDFHTHIGEQDPDGFRSAPEDLLPALERADASAVVFPMHEPGGYRRGNDEVLAAAGASDGRLVPFCRVDPHDEPLLEAARALDAGARGIKLHPRAESFALSLPAVAELCALAADRHVPVLVHSGRGIPALGRDALALCQRFPDLSIVLAHAGVSDLSWLWRYARAHPGLLFDTAWWSAPDLLALFALVPPGQVVFGSDAPYGTPVQSAFLTLRCALQAGLSVDQLGSVMGGQGKRLLAGETSRDLGPASGENHLTRTVLLDRVHSLLAVATRLTLHGHAAEQEIALARLACEVGERVPEAEVCRHVLTLLDLATDAIEQPRGAARQHPAAHLVVAAAVVARTPDVALPAQAAPRSVGAREP